VLGEQLDDASDRLQAAREREGIAVRAAEDAYAQVERTGDEVVRAERELGEAERQLGALARRAYVHGRGSVDPMLAALAAADTQERLADRLHYLERTVGAQAASLESAATLTVQLASLRERARAEAALAADALREAEEATATAAETHAEVLVLTDEASRAVAAQQEQLEVIATQRRELAAQADELAARAEAEEAARAAAARSTSAAAGAPPGGLTTVRGITVATALAPALEALLDAAAADGLVLGGSGYRSPEVTARLRMANGCPDVYNSPASACRIPTARPGSSEHERGLAVDFTYRGQTICYPRPSSRCRGNAAFDWLRANAARFGFHNLPAEAWHWSTTGR
jgi:zinc D-Ala-D-Ala carboxypeptidase